jgi:6,7-dimethyl-8-ribityllumazine synthase
LSVETHGDGTLTSPGARVLGAEPLPRGARIAVVVSRYHSLVTQRLLDGALEAALARGADVDVIFSPGSFELGILSLEAARSGRYAGVAALGCVIRGETTHYDYVCGASARGVLHASLETGVPVAFGVLTCETAEQAFARAGGTAGNKGFEAVETALDTAATLGAVRAPAG